MIRIRNILAILLLCAGVVRAVSPTLPGLSNQPIPAEMTKVTVNEKPNAAIPLDAEFVDESGKTVTLRPYFTGKKPVVLQIGYFGCPMLCDLVSQGLLDSLKPVELVPGKDYDVIYLSFDPREKPELASKKKDAFVREFGKPQTAGGWHFLTGRKEQIDRITDATGFEYKWIGAAGQYSHPAAVILLTPDGRVSRYLYGVKFDQKTLRLSLVEASEGRIGTTMDRFILTCFRYDGKQGRYAFAAIVIMRISGGLTVVILGIVIWRLLRREFKQRKLAAS